MSVITKSNQEFFTIIAIFIFFVLSVTEIYFGVLNIYFIITNFILSIIAYVWLYGTEKDRYIRKEFEDKIQRMKDDREESLSEIKNLNNVIRYEKENNIHLGKSLGKKKQLKEKVKYLEQQLENYGVEISKLHSLLQKVQNDNQLLREITKEKENLHEWECEQMSKILDDPDHFWKIDAPTYLMKKIFRKSFSKF